MIAMKCAPPFYKKLLNSASIDELNVKNSIRETFSEYTLTASERFAFLWDTLTYLYKHKMVKPVGNGIFKILVNQRKGS